MEEKGLILRSCDLSKGTGKGRVCSSDCVSKRKINANYRSEMGSLLGGAAAEPEPDLGAEHGPRSGGWAGMSGAGQPSKTLQGSLTARKTCSSSQVSPCQRDKFDWLVCKRGVLHLFTVRHLKKSTGYHAHVPSCFNTSQIFLCTIIRGGEPSW